jgi:hypothetical protein
METNNLATQCKKVGKRLLSSTALWLLALLLLVDFGSRNFNPLRYIDFRQVHAFQLTQAALTYKFSELTARKQAPDVMLVGTSLLMSPIFYLDGRALKTESKPYMDEITRRGLNAFQSYTEALYLRNHLNSEASRPVSIFNMSVAACMVSDMRLILSKVIQHSKQPKLLVLGLAPRDLADNLMPPAGSTPTYKALGDLADLGTLGPASVPPDIAQNLFTYTLSNYCRVRNDYKVLGLELASKLFNHPRDLADAQKWQKEKASAKADATAGTATPAAVIASSPCPAADAPEPVDAPKPAVSQAPAQQGQPDKNLADQLADYSKRYNPPDWKRFDYELNQLTELVKLCKQNNIDILFVNMPITQKNRDLYPDDYYNRYLIEVSNLAKREKLGFINFQDSLKLVDGDFLDAVHLDSTGGAKFQDALAVAVNSRLEMISQRAALAAKSSQAPRM